MKKGLLLLALSAVSLFAAGAAEVTGQRDINVPAIVMFLIFVGATLGVTYWAVLS